MDNYVIISEQINNRSFYLFTFYNHQGFSTAIDPHLPSFTSLFIINFPIFPQRSWALTMFTCHCSRSVKSKWVKSTYRCAISIMTINPRGRDRPTRNSRNAKTGWVSRESVEVSFQRRGFKSLSSKTFWTSSTRPCLA